MAPVQDHPRYPKAEYARRYREIRKRMRARGIDALVFYGDSGMQGGNQANVKYATNYKDPVNSGFVMLGNASRLAPA